MTKEEIEDYKQCKTLLMKCHNCQDNINGNCIIFNAKVNLFTYIVCLKYDLKNYEDYFAKNKENKVLLKAQEQERALKELFENHIELVVEKDRCYFKIKNSKGKEKSFTSYTMLDFWREVLK